MLLPQTPSDRAHQLMDRSVALDRKKRGYIDAAALAYPTEIIAYEINDHQIFGSFLFTCSELLAQPVVFFRR